MNVSEIDSQKQVSKPLFSPKIVPIFLMLSCQAFISTAIFLSSKIQKIKELFFPSLYVQNVVRFQMKSFVT